MFEFSFFAHFGSFSHSLVHNIVISRIWRYLGYECLWVLFLSVCTNIMAWSYSDWNSMVYTYALRWPQHKVKLKMMYEKSFNYIGKTIVDSLTNSKHTHTYNAGALPVRERKRHTPTSLLQRENHVCNFLINFNCFAYTKNTHENPEE